MKLILSFLFLASSLFAQNQAAEARAAAGCGPDKIQFDVKTDKNQHPLPKPDSGKAMVYVIQEREAVVCIGGCDTYRVGLDGAWVGANKGESSYSFFSVDPGDHNLCTSLQPRGLSHRKLASAASFTAEPGKSYYFRVRRHEKEDRPELLLKLELIDNAEGALIISSTPLSNSQQKK